MSNVGYATLSVIPSMRGMDRAMRGQLQRVGSGAGREAGQASGRSFSSSFVSRVGSAATAAGRSIVSGLEGAAAVAGGLFATSLFKGWDRLTTIQDSTAALTITLQDANAAAELLDDVMDVVTGTPFNFDQFASAAQRLVGFGVEVDKIPGYLTAIGEASATQGRQANEFADRLATVFGQIAASGQVNLADVWRISDTGVNALAILANHFGVARDEMKDMISEGAVPAEEALDALAKGIMEGTEGPAGATVALAGTMEGLRETLSGSAGGLGAAMARFGARVLEPFTESLVGAFTAGAEGLDELGERLGNWAERTAESEGFRDFVDWLVDVPSRIGPAIDRLRELGPALGPLVGVTGALGAAGLSRALGPLGAIIPTINPLIAGLAGFAATSPQVREAIADLVDAFREGGLDGAIEHVRQTLSDLDIGSIVSGWADAVRGWLDEGVVFDVVGDINAVVRHLAGAALDASPQVVDAFLEWASAAVDWVEEVLPVLLPELGYMAGVMAAWLITDGVPKLYIAMNRWAIAMIQWVATDLIPAIPGMMSAVSDAIDTALRVAAARITLTVLREWVPALSDWVDATRHVIGDKLEVLSDSIRDWVRLMAGRVAGWAVGMFDGIITQLDILIRRFNDLGDIGLPGGWTFGAPDIPEIRPSSADSTGPAPTEFNDTRNLAGGGGLHVENLHVGSTRDADEMEWRLRGLAMELT